MNISSAQCAKWDKAAPLARRFGICVAVCVLLSALGGCSMSMSGARPADRSAGVERSRRDDGKPVPERATRDLEHALMLMNEGRFAEAEVVLDGLVRDYGEYPGPRVNLAIIYRHDGRPDAAYDVLEQALEVDPGFPPANNQLGILLRRDGRFDEAEAAYRRALEVDPNYQMARHNLAILLDLYLGRPGEALEQYQLYQASLSEPDETVGRWIIDLERRVKAESERVAKEESR